MCVASTSEYLFVSRLSCCINHHMCGINVCCINVWASVRDATLLSCLWVVCQSNIVMLRACVGKDTPDCCDVSRAGIPYAGAAISEELSKHDLEIYQLDRHRELCTPISA